MKKKAIQGLIFLNSQQRSKLDSSNVHEAFNRFPKTNQVDIKFNAKRYAEIELESNYGIKAQEPLSTEDRKLTQQILNKINQIKRANSVRLAGFIQRITQKMSYEELEEARQFLQALNKKEVKELGFTLDILQRVVKQKLERQKQLSQNHTIAAAMSLIEELKKVKKVDEL